MSHLSRQVGFFEFFWGEGSGLIIEFEESLSKLEEEEVVVVDEGGDAGLGVEGGVVGVSLVGDFVSEVVDNLFKGFEMSDVFTDELLGVCVWFFVHESVEGLLIVSNDFPGGADAGEHLW